MSIFLNRFVDMPIDYTHYILYRLCPDNFFSLLIKKILINIILYEKPIYYIFYYKINIPLKLQFPRYNSVLV